MDNKRRFCAWITAKEEDLDRTKIAREFGKFGRIQKIFIDQEKTFGKVYFENLENLREACENLNNFLSWQIKCVPDTYQRNTGNNRSVNGELIDLGSGGSISNSSMIDDSDGDDYNVVNEYVDLHGRKLLVLEGDNGELFVSLKDVKRAGFSIFKRDNYDPVLASKNQILREFEMYLLSEGRSYLLKTKANLNEREILDTIERVKNKLINSSEEYSRNHQGNFGQGRRVNSNLTITANSSLSQNTNKLTKQGLENFGSNRRSYASKDDQRYVPRQRQKSRERGNRQNSNVDGFQNGFSEQPNYMRKPKIELNKQWEQLGAKPKSSFEEEKGRFSRDEEVRQSEVSSNKEVHWDENIIINERVQVQRTNLKVEKQESYDNKNRDENIEADKNVDRQQVQRIEMKVERQGSYDIKNNISNSVPLPQPMADNVEKEVHKESECLKVPENIETVQLEMRSEGEMVYITRILKRADRENIYFVQLLRKMEVIDQLLVDINTIAPEQETLSPCAGQLCLVQFEDVWYRGQIVSVKNSVQVDLIDYGNREYIQTPVKVMPSILKETPAQAIRIVISKDQNLQFEEEDNIKVSAIKKYDDGTYVVSVIEEKPLKPNKIQSETIKEAKIEPLLVTAKNEKSEVQVEPAKEKMQEDECYTTIPNSIKELKNGEKVMVMSAQGNSLILRSKQCCIKSKEIYQQIGEVNKKVIKSPKIGQLVLCSKEGLVGFHRAVIKEIEGTIAKVIYLDYCDEASLLIKSLINVNLTLANQPRAFVVSPTFKPLEEISNKGIDILNGIIESKLKLAVVLEGENFDLKCDDGTLLSEKLTEKPPSPPTLQPVVQHNRGPEVSTPIVYDDMDWITPKMGINTYMCYSLKDVNEFTLLSMDNEYTDYLDQVMNILVKDETPYSPALYEMCLASFADSDGEASWYRGVVTEYFENNDQYLVMFVDFGNSEPLKRRDLRKFPEYLKDIPILGIYSYFDGLPNKPNVVKRLKELIQDGDALDVNIKVAQNEDLKYGIEIPTIYEKLRQEGLI